ncbi:COX5A Cytochrome c oxidase subunit 5A [Candida maltosa Xu316]
MKSLQRAALRTNRSAIVRFNSTVAPRAISTAYIGNLESRWGSLPEQEQQSLIEELKGRMELPWQELTPAEKKAAYYISFGEWGPRSPLYQPGDKAQIWTIVGGAVALSIVLFAALQYFGPKPPASMSRDWQDKSDEYLKSKNANPFTGYSQLQ